MITLTLLLDGILGRQSNAAENDDDHDEGIKAGNGDNAMDQNPYGIGGGEDEHGGIG